MIDKMLSVFKSHNPQWDATKVILTDKDMNERSALQHAFPDVILQLCLFHVLRSFGREVTTSAMAIRASERQLVVDIFQRMAYSHTAEDYSELRRQLHETGLDSVVTYFEANWHPLRAEWANCFLASGTFGNRTNNRLESINQKIKSVCSAYGNLNDFFRELRTVLTCLRVERDNVALNCVSKVSLFTLGDSVAAQYSRLLLPYPAGLVRTELARSEDVKVVDNQISGVTASSDGCTCRFHAYALPPHVCHAQGLWTTSV